MPCPPAPPKAPPRCHSRGVSWARRHNLQDEPQAPWSARSGRYAAVCVCAAPPTRDLSAQPPDRMPTVALARAMVRHRFRSCYSYLPPHVARPRGRGLPPTMHLPPGGRSRYI